MSAPMYPERRPYATATPHAGYCAKPVLPQPPADALKMLRSHMGFDDPAAKSADQRFPRIRAGPRTYPGVATPADSTTAAPVPSVLLPDQTRTSEEALRDAELDYVIEHDTHNYHGCQQAVLNVELREKVEDRAKEWEGRVVEAREMLKPYLTEGALVTASVVEGLKAYMDAYTCTDKKTVEPEEVVSSSTLRTTLKDVSRMQDMPVVQIDTLRRSLDNLLNSPYLIAPLEKYENQFTIFDRLAHLREHVAVLQARRVLAAPSHSDKSTSARSVGDAESDAQASSGTAQTLLLPSHTALAFHEHLHLNPGDYAARELKKSEKSLTDLEDRVRQAKLAKEAAIDAEDPVEALRNLHAEVDYANDLLLLDKTRMTLVEMHGEDVRTLRGQMVHLIEDGRRAAQAVQQHTSELLPTVHYDTHTLNTDMCASKAALDAIHAADTAAQAAMTTSMRENEQRERALWMQMADLFTEMEDLAKEKVRIAESFMNKREERSRAEAEAKSLLYAQEKHAEQLRHCEEVLLRWQQASEMYEKYIDACTPKLLRHLTDVEDQDADLQDREAQDYVRRYELFSYAAEEARAKRSAQMDRMRLVQRSTQLSQEVAEHTLDPDTDALHQRLDYATRELEEVDLYLKYLSDMVAARRAEVDPVVVRVLAVHPDLTIPATQEEAPATKSRPATMTAAEEKKEKDALVVPGMATVAHPMVSARVVGIAHEEAYMQRQKIFTGEELAAVEEKMDGIRRSKAELATLETKYMNGDDVRYLLGIEEMPSRKL